MNLLKSLIHSQVKSCDYCLRLGGFKTLNQKQHSARQIKQNTITPMQLWSQYETAQRCSLSSIAIKNHIVLEQQAISTVPKNKCIITQDYSIITDNNSIHPLINDGRVYKSISQWLCIPSALRGWPVTAMHYLSLTTPLNTAQQLTQSHREVMIIDDISSA